MSDAPKFDPARYLTKLGSADYLEVKWRLVWLRETHPDATIDTDLHESSDKHATFKARVSIPGGGSATGWATETMGDFRDFLEKAETKALGRALAALGFGTQFTHDFDSAIADAPVNAPRGHGGAQSSTRGNYATEHVNRETGEITRPQATAGQPATEKQVKFLHAIAKDAGLSHTDLHDRSVERFNKGIADLDRVEISNLIDGLKSVLPAPAPTPIRQTDAAPIGDVDETAWTEFWRWARLQGVNGAPKFTELTSRSIQGLNPVEARAVLTATLASMPQTPGTAGADRFTQ